MLLRKKLRNKNVKKKTHNNISLGKGSSRWISHGMLKSVHYDYDSKGCCSNNILFLIGVWCWIFYFWFFEKIKKQTCEDQNLPHGTSHSKRWVGDLFTFSMGCCKSVRYSTMIQKDAVQTTWCFDNGCWWLFFFYGFWKQNKKQNGEDQHVPNVTSHLKKIGGGICSNFFRGML